MLTKFNDYKRHIVNVEYIESVEFKPTVVSFNDDLEYFIRLNLVSGNHYTLGYYDFETFKKDKNYLENNLMIDIR